MDYPPALLNIQGIKGLAARHPVPHTTGVSVPRTIYYYSLGAALLLLLYLLAYRYRRSTGFLLGKLYTGNTGILSFILAWLRLASSWVLSLLHRPTPKELGGSQVQHSTGPPAPLVMVVNARSGNGQGKLVTDAVQGLLMERGPGGVLEVLPLSLEGLAAALRRVREVLGISGGSGSGEAGAAIAAAGDGSVATAGAGSSPNSSSSSSSSSSFSPTTLGPHSPLLPPLPVRLVCAGGDGTVSAVAGVLNACGLSRVPLAVLPLGTGNDMARSLGMGGSPPPLDAPTLGAWLARVSTAPVTPCDVWSVSFGVHPGGSIRVLRHGVETALHETSVRGSGVLYCSTGLDARLVWEVERRRSGSRWANRALYALLGAGLVVGGSFSNAWEAVRGCWRRRRGRGGWCGCWSSTTSPMQQQQHYPPFTSFLESLSMDNHALGGSGGGEPGLTFGGKLPPLQSLIAVSSPSYAGGTNLWPSTWTLSPFNFRSYFTPLHHLRQQQGGGGHQGKVPPPPPLPPSPSSPSGGRSSLEQQGTTAVAAVAAAAATAAKPQPSSVSRASNRPPLWAMALKHQAATLTADVSWALSLAFPCAPRAVVMAWGAWLGSHTPPSLTLWAMGCLPWCCKRGGAGGVGGLTLDSQPLPPPPPPPAVLGAGLERGWLAQSMSDGHMELIGVSSLFSISGAIGLRCGILGGLHRLGQPSSLNLTWPPPDINLVPSASSSSSSSAAVQGGVSSPRLSSLTFLVAAVARSLEGIRRWWGEGVRRFRWGGYSGGGGGGSGGMGGALAPRRGGKGHGVGGTPGSSSFHMRRKSRVGRRITRWRDEVEAEYEGEEEDEEGGARGRRERDIERGEGEVESYEEYEEDEDREEAEEEEEEEEVLDLVYPTTPGPPPSRFRSMSPFPHLRIPSILRMAGSAVKGIRAKVGLRTLLRRGRRRLLGEKVPAPPVWAPPEDFEGDAESLLGGGAGSGGGGGDSDSLRSRSVSPEEAGGGKRGGFATLHRAQLAPPPPTPQWRVVNERGGLDTPAPPPATVTAAAAAAAAAVQVAVVGTPGVTEESGGKEGHGHSQTNSTAATATTTTTSSSSSEPPPPLSTPTGTVVYLQVDGEAYKLDSPSFLTIEYSGKVYFVRF